MSSEGSVMRRLDSFTVMLRSTSKSLCTISYHEKWTHRASMSKRSSSVPNCALAWSKSCSWMCLNAR